MICSVGMAVLPLCTNLVALVLTIMVGGGTMGMLDSAGNVAMMWLHGSESGPFIQALHFFFGVGACLAPLLEVWFTAGTDGTRIKWAFWTCAAAFVPVAVWILCLRSPPRPEPKGSKGSNNNKGEMSSSMVLPLRTGPTRREWMIVLLAGLLLALDVGAEIAYGGFIFLYGVEFLGMEERSASELTSLFWGALALGRFLAIFISMRWTPGRMLLVNLLGCFLASSMIAMDVYSERMLWVATFFYGLAQASVFPTVLALAESFMDVSGLTATVIVFGASLGEMVVPLILSVLFKSKDRRVLIWLVWILVIDAVLSLLALLAIMPLGWANRKERAGRESEELELGELDSTKDLDQLTIDTGMAGFSLDLLEEENIVHG